MATSSKRKFGEYYDEHQGAVKHGEYAGVGSLLADLKQASPREPLLHAQKTNPAGAQHESRHENDGGPSDSREWQIAVPGDKKMPKRKRAGEEKDRTKYPELTCHGKVNAPIRIADLQTLTLYTLADAVAPNWVAFKHAHHTRKVVVVMVPGFEKGMFDGNSFSEVSSRLGVEIAILNDVAGKGIDDELPRKETGFEAWKNGSKAKLVMEGNPIKMQAERLPQALRPLADLFDHVWPVKAPGDSRHYKLYSPIQAMLISPLPQSKTNKVIKGPKPPAEEKGWDSQPTIITEFIHTVDELREADYPIHPAMFTDDIEAKTLEEQRREKTGQNAEAGWVDIDISSLSECEITGTIIQKGSITAGHTVYAVDCEMVLTSDDKYSLARISVVDWDGKIVLDDLVKPSLHIKNYFTQYSGITEQILDPVKTTLAEVQSKLLNLFTPQSILLGHSLESDLNAMKMTHPCIVDTSLIYPHPRGLPLRSSLKYLAQKYLRREIQQQDGKGHNSVEDALAVLDLVKMKCEKGPRWGTSEALGEPIFRRLGRKKKKDAGGKDKNITSAIIDYGTPERGYGKEATIQIGCDDDEGIVNGITRAVKGDADGKLVPGGGVDFIWARLRELESLRGWCNNNREYTVVDKLHGQTPIHSPGPEPSTAKGSTNLDTSLSGQSTNIETALKDDGSADHRGKIPKNELAQPAILPDLQSSVASTVSHIQAIHDALPPCTLFIVYTGTGDPREVGRLQKMQQQFRREFKLKKWDDLSVKWTDDEEVALKMAVEKAREGIAFMCVK